MSADDVALDLNDNTIINDTAPLIAKPVQTGASISSTAINLTNCIVGAGVLTLATAFKNAGAGLALVVMSFVCFLAATSFILLASCCEKTGELSYKGVAMKVFGPKWGSFVELFVFLYTSGSCIGYCVLLGDYLPNLLHEFFPDSLPSILYERRTLIILVALIVLLPLALLPKLDALKYTSIAAVVCAAYLVCVVVYRYFTNTFPLDPDRGPIEWFRFSPDVFLAIPLMAVSFTAHYNVPNLYKELDRRSPKRFSLVVAISCATVLTLYVAIGLCGYFSFRSKTDGNILKNYGEHDVLALASRAALSLTLCFSFPLVCFALRRSVENMLFGGQKPYYSRQVYLATLITAAAVGIAITQDRIEKVLRISGSTAGMTIVFILPGLFYLLLTRSEKNKGMGVKRFLAGVVGVCGVFFLIVCSYKAFTS
ncbi:hypothetical protein RCL1_006047 [Eukaryota sp. TZLM3-RCL]